MNQPFVLKDGGGIKMGAIHQDGRTQYAEYKWKPSVKTVTDGLLPCGHALNWRRVTPVAATLTRGRLGDLVWGCNGMTEFAASPRFIELLSEFGATGFELKEAKLFKKGEDIGYQEFKVTGTCEIDMSDWRVTTCSRCGTSAYHRDFDGVSLTAPMTTDFATDQRVPHLTFISPRIAYWLKENKIHSTMVMESKYAPVALEGTTATDGTLHVVRLVLQGMSPEQAVEALFKMFFNRPPSWSQEWADHLVRDAIKHLKDFYGLEIR